MKRIWYFIHPFSIQCTIFALHHFNWRLTYEISALYYTLKKKQPLVSMARMLSLPTVPMLHFKDAKITVMPRHSCQRGCKLIMIHKCQKSEFTAHYAVNYWVSITWGAVNKWTGSDIRQVICFFPSSQLGILNRHATHDTHGCRRLPQSERGEREFPQNPT